MKLFLGRWTLVGAYILILFSTPLSAKIVPNEDASVFHPNSVYSCRVVKTDTALLSSRADWVFEDSSGQPFGGLSLGITELTFGDSIEVGNDFVFEASGGFSDGITKYRSRITGRSKASHDLIMFWGAYGEGTLSASRIPAGTEYPVVASWVSLSGDFSVVSYMYCSRTGIAK